LGCDLYYRELSRLPMVKTHKSFLGFGFLSLTRGRVVVGFNSLLSLRAVFEITSLRNDMQAKHEAGHQPHEQRDHGGTKAFDKE
jgi:hypothetical protein